MNTVTYFRRHRRAITRGFTAGIIAGVLGSVLLLSGCSSNDDSVGTGAELGGKGLTVPDSDAHGSRWGDGTNGDQPQIGIYSFGELHQGNRGTITVSEPRPYNPPDWMATGKAQRFVVLDVTVENQMPRGVVHDWDWMISATIDGRTARDASPASDSFLPVNILPGRTGSWKIAYAVPANQPSELVVAVGFGLSEPIYWQGRV